MGGGYVIHLNFHNSSKIKFYGISNKRDVCKCGLLKIIDVKGCLIDGFDFSCVSYGFNG